MEDFENQYRFLTLKEAARFLSINEQSLEQLVLRGQIRYCRFPPDNELRFWPSHLKDWGLSYEVKNGYKLKSSDVLQDHGNSLISEICRRFSYETKKAAEYISLCFQQRAFAQLHPRIDNSGLDLALRECGWETGVPKTSFKQVPIEQLNGFNKTNKNWLKGIQHTKQAALALFIPNSLIDDNVSSEWRELENLLEYAKDKLLKELKDRNLLRIKS